MNIYLVTYFTIKLYLCDNRFRHASHKTAYQGGTFTLYRFYGIHETADRLSTAKTDAERTWIDNQKRKTSIRATTNH